MRVSEISARLRATRALLRDVLTLHERFHECTSIRERTSIVAHIDYIQETLARMKRDSQQAAHRPPYEERVFWRVSDALRRSGSSKRPSLEGHQRPSIDLPLDVVAGLVQPSLYCRDSIAMARQTTQLLGAVLEIVQHMKQITAQ